MTTNGWLQIAFFSVALLLITKPLGIYVFKVFDGSMGWLRRPNSSATWCSNRPM